VSDGHPTDRAQRWLHERVRALRDWRRREPDWPLDELLVKALAGVEALVAADAVPAADGEAWAARLRAEAAGGAGRPDPGPAVRARADAVLAGHLGRLPDGAEPPDEALQRFEGVLHLLSAVGAADAGAWDARQRERAGWPTAEEELGAEQDDQDGTEAVVLGVQAGGPLRDGGDRVVLVVRFADAVTVEVARADRSRDPDWPAWRLADDLGTGYWCSGEDDDGDVERVTFQPGPPPGARRLVLGLVDRPDVRIEVALP
jgi:hypothetical protein